MANKVCSMDEALDLIQDGSIMACSGFGMAAMAEEVFLCLEKRFLETGRPRDLTVYNGSGLCDSKGAGTDHLTHEGLLKRVVAGFYGTNYKMCDMIAQNKVEAYNFPQGSVMRIFRESLIGNPGHLTKIGLKTFVDPRLEGGKMSARTTEDLVKLVELDGEEYLYYHAPRFNIGIIRGTTADTEGNICVEEEVVRADSRVIAMAARACGGKVIAQVKNIVPAGSLNADQVYIPGIYVDAVVKCKDPIKNHRPIGDLTQYDPSLTGHIRVTVAGSEPMPLNAKKVIARRCAMELTPDSIVNLGIGTPEFIAAVAAEEGVYDQMTLTAESGAIGGIPCSGDEFGSTRNPICLLDQPSQFDFYDGGGLDVTFLGFAQTDADGNINLSRFDSKIYGSGGSINISQSTKNLIFCGTFTAGGLRETVGSGKLQIEQEGRSKKFLQQIDQVTYSGELGAEKGQNVLYITERAVFRLTEAGLLLTEIAPGIDLQRDVLDQMEFQPEVDPNLRTMDEALFRKEPIGLKQYLAHS